MTFISSLRGVALLLSIFKLNQVKSNVGSCGVGKPDDPGENLSEQGREPTNSTHYAETGNRIQATLVEGKSCHHCANPAHSIIRVLTSDR